VSEPLRHPAHEWDFHPLVRHLVERLRPRVSPGQPGRPEHERIRFTSNPSLGFPPSDVDSIEWSGPEGEERATVTVNFMGLHGQASPLPLTYPQELLWDLQEPEGRRLRDFLDLFNHRMVSLLFRARQKYRHAQRFDGTGDDEFTARVLALAGLDDEAVRGVSGARLQQLLRGLGVLASRHRSASGLEDMLRACFPGIGVTVVTCIPRRLAIPADQRLYLQPPRRTAPRRGDALTGLGRDTCVGTSRVDSSSAFRVELGPMDFAEFRRFLPGERDFDSLGKLTRLYVQDPLDFDVELRLRPTQRPALSLAPAEGLRLGQTTWVTPTDAREGAARLRVPAATAASNDEVTTAA
jgi:type VI secretion system protein ImpH